MDWTFEDFETDMDYNYCKKKSVDIDLDNPCNLMKKFDLEREFLIHFQDFHFRLGYKAEDYIE
jgi:hypothetical protein